MSNKSNLKRWWLYILKLQDDKYYVGITSKLPEERLKEHVLGKRAAYWTLAHKPQAIELFEDLGVVTREHAEKYENKITRSLMKERGINAVRGGDLRDTGDYSVRFGRIFLKKDWEIFSAMILFMLTTLYLLIDKYFM